MSRKHIPSPPLARSRKSIAGPRCFSSEWIQSESARLAQEAGLVVHAGHGLGYTNVGPIADIPGMTELNIGHSIVSRAVFVGLRRAVREMVRLVQRRRG